MTNIASLLSQFKIVFSIFTLGIIIKCSKKHTKENEDGDRSSGFSSQTCQTPLYSGHVPTSLLQKGIIIFMKYTFFNLLFQL